MMACYYFKIGNIPIKNCHYHAYHNPLIQLMVESIDPCKFAVNKLFNVKYLPLFHHFKAIYQFSKHIFGGQNRSWCPFKFDTYIYNYFSCIYQLRSGTKSAFEFHNHWSVQISVILSNLKKNKNHRKLFYEHVHSNFHQYILMFIILIFNFNTACYFRSK